MSHNPIRNNEIIITAKELIDYPTACLLDADTIISTLQYKNYEASIYVCGNTKIEWSASGDEEDIVTLEKASQYPNDLQQLIRQNHTQREITILNWECDNRVKKIEGNSRFIFSIDIIYNNNPINIYKKGANVGGQTYSMIKTIIQSEFDNYILSEGKKLCKNLENLTYKQELSAFTSEELQQLFINLNNIMEYLYLDDKNNNNTEINNIYTQLEAVKKENKKREHSEKSSEGKKRFLFFKRKG